MTRRVVLICAVIFLSCPALASGVIRHATPATFAAQYAAAQGGDTVRLASGTYPQITGKVTPGTGRIVLAPEPGASPSVSFRFDGAVRGLTLSKLLITSGLFNSADATDIRILNSDVPGQIVFRVDAGIQDAGILLRGNTFRDWDFPGCCTYEGRVSVCGCGNSNFTNGITIRDNVFRDGASDGIQDSATGTRIIHNEFFGIHSDDATGVHADPIQVWGGCCHLIAGNFIHDTPGVSVLMMPDGIDHEIIRDNVVAADPSMYPFAFTVFADNGSIIRNNTLAYANNACAFAIDCGGIRMGTKGPTGSGTQVFNNVVGWINNETGSTSNRYDNLVASTDSGTLDPDEELGVPTFVGGASPASYCGYALAPGSLGQGWGARTSLYC